MLLLNSKEENIREERNHKDKIERNYKTYYLYHY